MKKIKTYLIYTALLSSVSNISLAGAGANVKACIYLPTKPLEPLVFNFETKGKRCMNESGNNITFEVTEAGVTCGSVNYVEGKSSSSGGDLCATAEHHWELSYDVVDKAYSDSADLSFEHPFMGSNYVKFNSKWDNVRICQTRAMCDEGNQTWSSGDVGDLYVIFKPKT